MVSSIVHGSFHLLSSVAHCFFLSMISAWFFGGGVQDAREDALRRAASGSARVCAARPGRNAATVTLGWALNLFHVIDCVAMKNAQATK
jgi:hypothetical protein